MGGPRHRAQPAARPARLRLSGEAPQETVDSVLPDLAEKWSWQDTHRNLVVFVAHNSLYNWARKQEVWLDK